MGSNPYIESPTLSPSRLMLYVVPPKSILRHKSQDTFNFTVSHGGFCIPLHVGEEYQGSEVGRER
jgi:hypothetical protein